MTVKYSSPASDVCSHTQAITLNREKPQESDPPSHMMLLTVYDTK